MLVSSFSQHRSCARQFVSGDRLHTNSRLAVTASSHAFQLVTVVEFRRDRHAGFGTFTEEIVEMIPTVFQERNKKHIVEHVVPVQASAFEDPVLHITEDTVGVISSVPRDRRCPERAPERILGQNVGGSERKWALSRRRVAPRSIQCLTLQEEIFLVAVLAKPFLAKMFLWKKHPVF